MAYAGSSGGSYADLSGLRSEGKEPGARRKKLAGYLKAANELRQSYMTGDGTHFGNTDGMDDRGLDSPGAFPDAAVVRHGNEEMILFPSYARHHIKSKVDTRRIDLGSPLADHSTSHELCQARYKRVLVQVETLEILAELVMPNSGVNSGINMRTTTRL